MTISFTLLTSTNCLLTKEFSLVDGALKAGTIANMATGESKKLQIDDVTQLKAVMQVLAPENALCCGLNIHGDTALTTRRAAENGDPATPRIGSAFAWPLGPALFPIDVDVDEGSEFRSVEAVLDALESCSEWIKDALRVAKPSASSYVHGRGLRGVHVYLAVTDGQKIPDLAKRLQDDQWLAGRGFIKISRSGALLVRQLSDASIYQTQRILFEAAPKLHEGVTRHVPEDQQWVVRARQSAAGRPPAHAENGMINVTKLAPLKALALRQAETMRSLAKQHSKPEANRAAFAWHKARAAALGWDDEAAERMATAAIHAREAQQLPRDMLIAFEHYGLQTVGDILARWDDVAGEPCAAPDDALRDDLTPGHYTKAVLTARNSKRGIFSYKDQTFYTFQEQTAPQVDRWTRAAIKLDGAIEFPERMGKSGSTPQSNTFAALSALNDELGRPLRYNAATSTADETSKGEVSKILLALPRVGCMGVTDTSVRAAMAMVIHANSYDPWRDYIDALPAWDGVPRLDTIFEDVCGAPSSPALVATGQYLFAGIVRRQLKPGASHDVVPVLISETQGWGKSRHFVKALAAAVGCPATPAIEFADAVKMSLLARTSMVAELAEMSGHAKKDVEAVKTWATNSDDVYRDLYEVSATPHPRRFVLIGTANKHELNNDSTGNRRFMPVMVTHEIDPTWVVEVPQLLAEAKERFCESDDSYGALAARAARAVDAYTKEQMRRGEGTPTDGMDEWLLPIFDKLLHMDGQNRVRSRDVLAQVKLLGLNRDVQPKKVAEWARSRGWTSEKKYNGNVYYPPDDYVPLAGRGDNDSTEPLTQAINPFADDSASLH